MVAIPVSNWNPTIAAEPSLTLCDIHPLKISRVNELWSSASEFLRDCWRRCEAPAEVFPVFTRSSRTMARQIVSHLRGPNKGHSSLFVDLFSFLFDSCKVIRIASGNSRALVLFETLARAKRQRCGDLLRSHRNYVDRRLNQTLHTAAIEAQMFWYIQPR